MPYNYYDDFYEPSEFDVKVEEWKEELGIDVPTECMREEGLIS